MVQLVFMRVPFRDVEVAEYYVLDGQARIVLVGPEGFPMDLPASHTMLEEVA
ncbi:hypothetical protein ABZ192_12540 [Streptomyces sp. NPDC006235]|uniref:hypothetical protein n=1 Tax=Streptomyces sp. NPDC006235 TaxID=3156736 RepID=UPI0033BC8104